MANKSKGPTPQSRKKDLELEKLLRRAVRIQKQAKKAEPRPGHKLAD
jgi:hypothetical protein